MTIRHIIIASIAAAGFSIAASAAPAVQQAPIAQGSQLTFVHDHHHAKAEDKAPVSHRRHHHHHHRYYSDPLCPIAPWCWH
jgi:hypothetical protein